MGCWWSTNKIDNWSALSFESSAGASGGAGDVIASESISGSGIKYSDNDGEIRFGSGLLRAEAGIGLGGATIGYSANLDAVNIHTSAGFRGNVRLDFGGNLTAGLGGVEVKAAGLELALEKIWDLALH